MRKLLLFIVMLGGILVIDWIASEGRYSRAVWREAREQANSIRYRVEYWLDGIVSL